MQVPDYSAFTGAVAEQRRQPETAFAALCELTRELVGVKLFTVMTHDGRKGVASRIYSNMPDAYPVSGTKPANQTDWSRQVIDNKQIFVANDIDGIAAVFSDHELIRSLGCEIRHQRADRGRRRGARHHQLPARSGLLHQREGRGGRGIEAARRRLPAAQRTEGERRLMANRTIRVATDVGGTFTDLVCFETDHGTGQSPDRHGQVRHDAAGLRGKACSTCWRRAASTRRSVDFLAHGTTVVINALTERKGVKVGLITTEGFRDTLEIARGNRPDFFNLHYEKPKPFVPRYLRRELPGRISYKGAELKPLDLSGLPAILDDFRKERRRGDRHLLPAFLRQYEPRAGGAGRGAEVVARRFGGLLAPDHPRMARIRALQHRRAVGLCAADRRALSVAPARRAQGEGLRQEPLHHAVELRRRFAGIGVEDPDHHGRVRAGLRLLGCGRARQADRRAQHAGARHRRHDRKMLADRERRGQDQDRLLDRARPHLGRLSDHGAGGRPRRDRQWRRLDRLGRRFRQAACRTAIGRRGAGPRRLRPRRRPGDDHRRQSLARPHQPRLFLRRRDRGRHGIGRSGDHGGRRASSASMPTRRRAASSASPTTTWSTR